MDFDAPAPSDDRLPAGTRIGRAALRVADLDETTAFYRDVVGLAVLDRDDDRATLGVDGTILLVLDRDPDRPGGVGPTPASFTPRSAFPHAPRSARAGPCARAVAARRRFRPPRQRGAVPRRSRRQRRGDLPRPPREEWPVDDDGTVQMATEPLDIEGVSGAAGGANSDGDLVDRVPPGTDVGHMHLEVTSLSAFEAVYVDGLGFEVGMTGPNVRFVARPATTTTTSARTRGRGGRRRPRGAGSRGSRWSSPTRPPWKRCENGSTRSRPTAMSSSSLRNEKTGSQSPTPTVSKCAFGRSDESVRAVRYLELSAAVRWRAPVPTGSSATECNRPERGWRVIPAQPLRW